MSEQSESKRKRIKSLTIRFNKEALPFQHVRIEVTATITKEDDADEVKKEVTDFASETFHDIEHQIFMVNGNNNKTSNTRKTEISDKPPY